VRKAFIFGVLLAALIPAAHLAWVAREMPHFGHLHDDSIYFVCAKSLAEGHSYRILSLPGEPYQTKYPPLWPVALAGIWKIKPCFPENLRWGMPLAFAMLPGVLALAWQWFRRMELGAGVCTTLCALIALSPCVIVLSTGLMSDLPFTVALVAAILAIESAERGVWKAVAAGVLSSAAYLIKTAALPLIVAGPLWLMLRRKYREAVILFGTMLPAVAGWMLWCRAHVSQGRDLVTLYYTNYLGYQTYNVGWSDLPLVMWKNLDGVFCGIAELLIFDLSTSAWGMHLARFLAILGIAGTVRLARRRGMTPYHWFALGYTAVLLVWHFPPNNRFLLPLFPLLLAGFVAESANLADVIRNEWPRSPLHKTVVVGLCAGFGGIFCAGVVANMRAMRETVPLVVAQHRAVLASNRRAFAWIVENTPAGNFYAYDDPVFYLYTGRHAASLPVAPLPFYRQDRESVLRPFREMFAFAHQERLDYLLLTAADFHRDLGEAERIEVRRILERENAFTPIYRWSLSAVYSIARERAIGDTKRVEINTANIVKTAGAPESAHATRRRFNGFGSGR